MQNVQTTTTSTAIGNIISEFQSQIEYMAKNNNRLRDLSNKMEVDPPIDSNEKKGGSSDTYGEGAINLLVNLATALRQENSRFEYQLSRLEKFI